MPPVNNDYYKVLQVDPSADPEIIDAAYRRLARKYHPDMNKSLDATLRMQEINTAYGILRNPVKRAQYDRERSSQSSQSDSRYEEERRRREEAEAAWRHAKEEAEAARRWAEEERRKREEAEATQRRTEEERKRRERAETTQHHTESGQEPTFSYIICLKCYQENPSNSQQCIKCGQRFHNQERQHKRESAEAPEEPATLKGHKLSMRQAAQAISVTRGTLHDYIKGGRVRVDPDGTIKAVELLRAGFIIRNLPPRGE